MNESKLASLLADLFSAPELLRWVHENFGGEIAHLLPANIPLQDLTFELVLVLKRRGKITLTFFDLLSEARPARESEINTIRLAWFQEPTPDKSNPTMYSRELLVVLEDLSSPDTERREAALLGALKPVQMGKRVPVNSRLRDELASLCDSPEAAIALVTEADELLNRSGSKCMALPRQNVNFHCASRTRAFTILDEAGKFGPPAVGSICAVMILQWYRQTPEAFKTFAEILHRHTKKMS